MSERGPNEKNETDKDMVVCPSCDGLGIDLYDGNPHTDCQVCHGRGVVPAATRDGEA